MEGDAPDFRASVEFVLFQSTPPHGGRPFSRSGCSGTLRFQSTPPHGGRPSMMAMFVTPTDVSIHAPAWRATVNRVRRPGHMDVSIHAPAWRATDTGNFLSTVHLFQSTPPHGGRRVTRRGNSRASQFQSTPPHGGRQLHTCLRSKGTSFNPRPRMEGDLLVRVPAPSYLRFNPRPRMEGDLS